MAKLDSLETRRATSELLAVHTTFRLFVESFWYGRMHAWMDGWIDALMD